MEKGFSKILEKQFPNEIEKFEDFQMNNAYINININKICWQNNFDDQTISQMKELKLSVGSSSSNSFDG